MKTREELIEYLTSGRKNHNDEFEKLSFHAIISAEGVREVFEQYNEAMVNATANHEPPIGFTEWSLDQMGYGLVETDLEYAEVMDKHLVGQDEGEIPEGMRYFMSHVVDGYSFVWFSDIEGFEKLLSFEI